MCALGGYRDETDVFHACHLRDGQKNIHFLFLKKRETRNKKNKQHHRGGHETARREKTHGWMGLRVLGGEN